MDPRMSAHMLVTWVEKESTFWIEQPSKLYCKGEDAELGESETMFLQLTNPVLLPLFSPKK